MARPIHGRISLLEAAERLLTRLPSTFDLPTSDDEQITISLPAGIVRDLRVAVDHHPFD